MSEKDEEFQFRPLKLTGMFEEDSRAFGTVDDVLKWVNSEQDAWKWLNEIIGGNKSGVSEAFGTTLTRIKSFAQPLLNDNESRKNSKFNSLSAEIGKWKSLCGFTSNSRFGQFLIRLAEVDKRAASAAMHYMVKGASHLEGDLVALGALIVTGYRLGFFTDENNELSVKAHNAISVDWSTFHQRAVDDWKNHSEQAGKRIEDIDEQSRQFSHDHTERLKAAETELEEFKTFCRQGLALRAPVDYWLQRADRHNNKAEEYRKIFVASSFFAVGVVAVFAYIYIHPETLAVASQQGSQLWRAAVLFGVLGAAAWPLRIINKVWMSHLHLATDAEERATMIQTYLSMLEAKEVSEDERKFILPSLFHPSSTGIVNDDGGPSIQTEMLSRMLKNG